MNLREACTVLGVSPSGYYAHQHKGQRPRRIQDAALSRQLGAAFAASRGTYGSPRLRHALRQAGACHGKSRIARLMRQQGLQARPRRRFVPRTTVTDPDAPGAPNHRLTRPAVTRLNEVWLTDITYLPTAEGFLFLAAEMDLCSRRILGWSTHHSLATELAVQALERALQARGETPLPELLHHSDRGCQYTSAAFRQRLDRGQITQSLSRAGNCYDNAPMESFWATLKAECFGATLPATRAEAHRRVFDYIETFYNPTRLHSALGFLSPVNFEKQLQPN